MSSQDVSNVSDVSTPKAEVRGRSTIEFPYLDFDSAVEVAAGVHAVSGTSCEWNQLAAQLKQSPTGGGFRMRVMTARSFGMLIYDRGAIELTDLGIRVLDPKHAKSARAEAFLAVPLFKVMFERLNGQVLPPMAAIERMAEGFGVAPKQKDKARQVFMRSAKQAGYFDLDPDRLVSPPNGGKPVKSTGKEDDSSIEDQRKKNGGGDGSGGNDFHPFIQGLLQKLPQPETSWPIEGRAKWLMTAANIFDLLYADGGEETKVISIKVDTL